MVTNNSLVCTQTGISTFYHHNKTDNGEIDNILFNETRHQFVRRAAIVGTECQLNTSDHVPVIAELQLPVSCQDKGNTVIKCKPKWDKCDKQEYKNYVSQSLRPNHVSQSLRPFDSFHISNSSELDILYPIGHLNAVPKTAAEASIPNYKPEIKLKKKRARPWSKEIQEAVKIFA